MIFCLTKQDNEMTRFCLRVKVWTPQQHNHYPNFQQMPSKGHNRSIYSMGKDVLEGTMGVYVSWTKRYGGWEKSSSLSFLLSQLVQRLSDHKTARTFCASQEHGIIERMVWSKTSGCSLLSGAEKGWGEGGECANGEGAGLGKDGKRSFYSLPLTLFKLCFAPFPISRHCPLRLEQASS